MAGRGFDAVRFCLPWDAVEAQLGSLIRSARAAGLRVLPGLTGPLPGYVYAGPLLDAQVTLAERVAAIVQPDADGIVAWDILDDFSHVAAPRGGKVSTGEHGSAPVSEQEVAQWAARVSAPLRKARIAVTAGATADDLLADRNVRFGSLCMTFGFASMQYDVAAFPFARGLLDPEALPFLAMVTAAFSFKPVLVTSVGMSGLDPEQAASLGSAIVHRLHQDGRLGAYFRWADLTGDDGSATPLSEALTAFGRTAPEVRKAAEMPMISSTYYYRTLPDSTRTLYDAFLGFVEARRA